MNTRRTLGALVAIPIAVLGVGGCGADEDASASSGSSSASATEKSGSAQSEQSQSGITAADAWVKAATADKKMTAVFVTLTNSTEEDVKIVSAMTDMSSESELHEMVSQDGSMVMQEAPDGLVVPAGGSLTLEPGGKHIMVLSLENDVAAGETHEVTLTFDDGSELTFEAVTKDFAGANESYHGEDGSAGSGSAGSDAGTSGAAESGVPGSGAADDGG